MTDDEELVAALAEAMREARFIYYEDAADALLPVVRRAAEQRAAEAMTEAAEDWDCCTSGVVARHHLRARAAAIEAGGER